MRWDNSFLLPILVTAAMLTACGKEQPAAPAADTAASAPATTAAAQPAAPNLDDHPGKPIFGKTCALCHGSGIAGAPKFGDKDAWAPRIAQGKDTLYKHAIEGFTGEKGMMPPRGSGPSLTDDEIKAAVDYMVAKAQ